MISRLGTDFLHRQCSFNQLQRFVSHKKNASKRARLYARKPDKYKRVGSLVKFDYKNPDLVFPVNIGIKFNHYYSPKKAIAATPPSTDYINFRRMTGNEILLNLQNAEHFRDIEVIECLRALILTPGAEKHTWDEHDLFKSLLARINKHISNFTPEHLATMVRMFTHLNIKNEEFWTKTRARFEIIQPALKGKYFAYFFNFLMKSPETTAEKRLELAKVLPRELSRFNPNDLTQAFKMIVDNDLLTEHLWHHHFHILFWRRPFMLGLHNFPDLIDYMVKIDYLQEVQWWNESFLPAIDYYVNETTDDPAIKRLVESLEALGQAAPEIEVNSYIHKLNERSLYLNTKHILLQNAHFYKMVQSDLKYYKEKELAKMQNNL